MNYREALEYIHGIHRFGSKLGLNNIRELLKRLWNPHNRFRSIHVGGTNGKGSVTSMLTHVLHSAGYRVGMFISPYLERFTERIQVNLKEIPGDELGRITSIVKQKVDAMIEEGMPHPTEFEVVTAIGFTYFAQQNVDFAVVEVGLGGRLDATNVIDPLLSVITSIGYDHMDVLGDTLSQIAFEKAGIIKQGRPVVSYPQPEEVLEVLEGVAREHRSPFILVEENQIIPRYSSFGEQVFDFEFEDKKFEEITIRLSGRHQLLNAATALTAIMVLKRYGVNIPDKSIYEGMKNVYWPGRLEKIRECPEVIIDGAHNVSGARALANAVREYFGGRSIILIIGMLRDKDVKAVLSELCPLADFVIVTKPDSPRAMEPCELASIASNYIDKVEIIPEIRRAIDRGMELAGCENVLLVCGSLYLVGKVREYLRKG